MPAPATAVVVFDRISSFLLSTPYAVFADAQPVPGPYRLFSVAGEAGELTTTSGSVLRTDGGLAALGQAQRIIVPAWRGVDETPPEALLIALRAAHARGAQLVGLCHGTLVLAAAGLLDGRTATTHWAIADDLARRYPAVRVDASRLYVDEGSVVTSAGAAAAIDCCLHLVRRDLGHAHANQVARMMVMAPHRDGGQAPFAEPMGPAAPCAGRLLPLLAWLRGQLDAPHTLDALAVRACMSRRSFTRHFQASTGLTVGHWLRRERVALVKQLLEQGDEPLERVARRAGYPSLPTLRAHFRQETGMALADWRAAFGRRAPQLAPDQHLKAAAGT